MMCQDSRAQKRGADLSRSDRMCMRMYEYVINVMIRFADCPWDG